MIGFRPFYPESTGYPFGTYHIFIIKPVYNFLNFMLIENDN